MISSATDPIPFSLLSSRPQFSIDPDKGLMMEKVALSEIAQKVGTPSWVISATTLRQRAQEFQKAFKERNLPIQFHFAVKAQDHKACLTLLRNLGYGADVVSGGELNRALAAGIKPENIVFSGVGKTDDELRQAISLSIAQVNVESAEELFRLNELALSSGKKIRVALRVNPNVDAGTHAKITTGRAENKFGIQYHDIIPLYRKAQTELKGLHVIGLAVHLGSQIITEHPYLAGFEKLANIVRSLRQANLTVEELDCGGGLGIRYRNEKAPLPSMLANVIYNTLGNLDVKLRLEPGRWLAAPSGILLSQIIDIKKGTKNFAIVDAGMNDLVRPAMYESWHGILPLKAFAKDTPLTHYDVVGPICESSDVFAHNRLLPELHRGDLVAFLDAGAYGSVMSSTYNSHPLAAQIMVEDDKWAVIRERQTLDDILRTERLPEWLES
ncbi:diaminopimelate decarboxylase [Aristophania vespae]|uniref:Diaminopimelate decarboxylase n=1 Tax=Aristophania vespae TaxID=2697033 RepID=A0A6P1NAI1_9PROT|nr:diaminopimelate decarboxylase [Aristophania vespae]QHI95416.1 diaminopimelate decarboxylase [Aristophania vespae]